MVVQVREIAGTAVGYGALFILGTPIILTGIAYVALTGASETYHTERQNGKSMTYSALHSFESVARGFFPKAAKEFEFIAEEAENKRQVRDLRNALRSRYAFN